MAVIKRIGVLKTSAFLGLYSFFVGIVFAIIMWIFSLFLSGLIGGVFSFGLLYLVLFPILSGIGSFIMGLITLPLMNLALKITKGVDFDLELAGHMY